MENKNVIAALIKAQEQMSAPKKTGENPRFRNKYAKLDDIYTSCQSALRENGLFLTHDVQTTEQTTYLITKIYHTSGEMVQSFFPMVLEQQTNQSIASARTYACRYSLCNLLAINFDEDDDGNAADAVFIDTIEGLLKQFPALRDRILKGYRVKSFASIPAKEREAVLRTVKARIDSGEAA